MEFISSNTDDFFQFGCSEYADNDKCSQIKPLKVKRDRPNQVGRIYSSPIFVMVDLMASIGANSDK